MATLLELFGQNPKQMLDLPPEELAGFLLEHIHSSVESDGKEILSREDVIYQVGEFLAQNDLWELVDPVKKALAEAWWWLEREGLVLQRPDNPERYFVTRRGNQLQQATDIGEFRKRTLLPRKILHPVIEIKAWPAFMRGDYDTAVFQSFKEMEIAVRNAGGFDNSDYGKNLVTAAFKPSNGPLTDASEVDSEQEALKFLFMGAVCRFKNPASHRVVGITDPAEAVELLCFASWLLKLVDERKPS